MKKVTVVINRPLNDNDNDAEILSKWLNQSYKDIEIVVATGSLLKNSRRLVLSKKFKNIKYFETKKTITNKSVLLKEVSPLVQGDYVIVVNPDDFYPYDYIEKMISSADESSTDQVIISRIAAIFPQNMASFKVDVFNEKDFFDTKDKDTLVSFFEKGLFWGWYFLGNKLIQKDLFFKTLDEVYGFTCHKNFAGYPITEDMLLCTKIFKNCKVREAVQYIKDTIAVFNWQSEDEIFIKNSKDITDILNVLYTTFDHIYNNAPISDKVSNETVRSFLNMFLRRFWHRVSWSLDNSVQKITENSICRRFMIDSLKLSNIDYGYMEIDNNTGDICPEDYLYDDESIINMNEETESDIHIFVSMHKESFVPKSKYLIPIQTGAAINETRFDNMFHDDEGENISEKNKRYCELTAQYWAWKNDTDADYYGFFHYRRYLSFNCSLDVNELGNIPVQALDEETLDSLCINDRTMSSIINCFDAIFPVEWEIDEGDGPITLYEHWIKHFEEDDLKLALNIINELYPHMYESAMNVLFAKKAPFCNLFIMKKDLFNEYSEFCFNILERIEQEKDHKEYSVEKYRTLGHIAERLVAVYAEYLKNKKPEKDILYLPTVLVEDTAPYARVELLDTDKKTVSIALACDDKYMKYTYVLLKSILDNASDDFFYDIVIMHRDISEYSKNIAYSIFRKHDNFSLRFVNVSRNFEKYNSLHISRHLSLETYYRFMIQDIFEDYDKVLYLDCDMVVLKDLSELYFTDIEGFYVGAVRDIDFIASYHEPDRKVLYDREIMDYIGFEDAKDYFQAGTILFNIKELKKQLSSKDLFDKAMARSWFYHDQDVLNSMFAGKVKYLDLKWNVFSLLEKDSFRSELIRDYLNADLNEEYNKSRKDIGIVHFGGTPKPWDTAECDLAYLFWEYARRSPHYEVLLRELYRDNILPCGNFTFVNDKTNNAGAPIFEINLTKDEWSENYIQISFTYLSDHDTPSKQSVLSIDVSILPDNIRINEFRFTNKNDSSLFRESIGYKVEDGKIIIYARCRRIYEGFAWRASLLESRSHEKPSITILNNDFITKPVSLNGENVIFH